MSSMSVVYGLLMLFVTAIVCYVIEITLGTCIDQIAFVFSGIQIASISMGNSSTWMGIPELTLNQFRYFHYFVYIIVFGSIVAVSRYMIMDSDYTRYRRY